MSDSHAERVRAAFTEQAAAFEDPHHNHLFTVEAQWLLEPLECSGRELVLDVAAGTGHAARALAARVRHVTALDATPAMLERGRAAAAREGLSNIEFVLGDAERLPFADGAFDLVVCRFALHHLEHPLLAVDEMARCLSGGGRLALADMVCSDEPELAREQNRIERLRDRSHAGMLSRAALEKRIAELGLELLASEVRALERRLAPWLQHAATPPQAAAAIAGRLREELEGGAPSGMCPSVAADGAVQFRQSWASLLAAR